MSDSATQSYATHARYMPAFHFFVLPVLLINVIVQIVAAVCAPGAASAWGAVVALALGTAAALLRVMTLTVQDRVIRLEETLRLTSIMPSRAADIARLSRHHMVGLRFASDAEVPGLVDRILAGEISSRKDIKAAVKAWRADHLRA
jgi:hypothetical protein